MRLVDQLVAWRACLPELGRFVFDWISLTLLLPIFIGVVILSGGMWGFRLGSSTTDGGDFWRSLGGPIDLVMTIVFGAAFVAASAMAALISLNQIPNDRTARRVVDGIATSLFALGLVGVAMFVGLSTREGELPIGCSIALFMGSFQSLVPALLRFRADRRTACARINHSRRNDSPPV